MSAQTLDSAISEVVRMETANDNRRILFCCLPKRGRGVTCYESAVAHWQPINSMEKTKKVIRATISSSLLTHGFNRMWCAAMMLRKTENVTHFAMIHDDIAPSHENGSVMTGWADVLMDELEKYNADIMSAVVPIKDHRGVTSTAIDTGDTYSPKRLTMKEIYNRPETFTEEGLLVNTGLWVCKLNKPWCEQVLFRQTDQIVVTEDGRLIARANPEDWDFSRQVRKLGGVIYATRKVPLFHDNPEFHNRSAWGDWDTEKGDPIQHPVVPHDVSAR